MFSEYISNLIRGWKVLDVELILKNFILDKMKVWFDMLRPSVKNRICS